MSHETPKNLSEIGGREALIKRVASEHFADRIREDGLASFISEHHPGFYIPAGDKMPYGFTRSNGQPDIKGELWPLANTGDGEPRWDSFPVPMLRRNYSDLDDPRIEPQGWFVIGVSPKPDQQWDADMREFNYVAAKPAADGSRIEAYKTVDPAEIEVLKLILAEGEAAAKLSVAAAPAVAPNLRETAPIDGGGFNAALAARENPRWDSEERQRQWQSYRRQVDTSVIKHIEELAGGRRDSRILADRPDNLKTNSVTGEKKSSRDTVADMMFDLQDGRWRGQFRTEDGEGVGQHRQMMDFAFRDMGLTYNPATNRYELPEQPHIAPEENFDMAAAETWTNEIRETLYGLDDQITELFAKFSDIRAGRDNGETRVADLLNSAAKVREDLRKAQAEISRRRAELTKQADETRDTFSRRGLESADEDAARVSRLAHDKSDNLDQFYYELSRSSQVVQRLFNESPGLSEPTFIRESFSGANQIGTFANRDWHPADAERPEAVEPPTFPALNFISAPGLTDWQGTDRVKTGNNGQESKQEASDGVIKRYAKMKGETAPPIGMVAVYVQPDGKLLARVVDGGAHRVAAAQKRGDKTVKIGGQISFYQLDHNII
jgi:hypothetical protein